MCSSYWLSYLDGFTPLHEDVPVLEQISLCTYLSKMTSYTGNTSFINKARRGVYLLYALSPPYATNHPHYRLRTITNVPIKLNQAYCLSYLSPTMPFTVVPLYFIFIKLFVIRFIIKSN